MSRFIGKRSLTLGEQMLGMRRLFPQLKESWARHCVSWGGTLLPTAMSANYVVSIKYALGRVPKAYVLSPPLGRCNGKPIPHVYEEGSLCLYLPQAEEWTSQKLIAETIVPWLAGWLYYYEVWHATGGEWLGGGVHPKPALGKSERTRNSHATKTEEAVP